MPCFREWCQDAAERMPGNQNVTTQRRPVCARRGTSEITFVALVGAVFWHTVDGCRSEGKGVSWAREWL